MLYDIQAAFDADGTQKVMIGNMVLDSNFIASEFGDRQLFFQHNIK